MSQLYMLEFLQSLVFSQHCWWAGGGENVIYLTTLSLRLHSVDGNVWRPAGMKLTGKAEVLQENHVSVSTCPRQMSHELAWNRSKPSVVIVREMLTKAEVLLEVTPCQFTGDTASHLRRTAFSKKRFFIVHSLYLCSCTVWETTRSWIVTLPAPLHLVQIYLQAQCTYL
jgi:hypothetical protein